jgi:hypothetical protein
MLLSTTTDLAPRTYEVRGFVVAHAILGALGGGKTDKMIQSLIEQAQRLGGDGIVDLKTVLGGDSAHCVMTGTAVRITG